MVAITLLYFIIGILAYAYIRPILQSFTELICQSLEFIKSKIILAQTKIQVNIENIAAPEDKEASGSKKLSAIGFTISPDPDEDDDEDYEEDDPDDQ